MVAAGGHLRADLASGADAHRTSATWTTTEAEGRDQDTQHTHKRLLLASDDASLVKETTRVRRARSSPPCVSLSVRLS